MEVKVCKIAGTLLSALFAIMMVLGLGQMPLTVHAAEIKLTASDRTIDDYFGWSVSIDGDYIAVGAWGLPVWDDEYDWVQQSGGVYLFKRDGVAWTQQAKLTKLPPGHGGEGYRFGYSVAIDEPYVIVGAPGQDFELISHGEAYVFKHELGI